MPDDAPVGVPAWWWRPVRDVSQRFLGEWGETAERLGWSTADLFAVDASRPYERIDQYGLCVLLAGRSGERVVALTAAGATIKSGRHLTSFRRPDLEPAGIVLVWTLANDG
ncbi:MAG: hypothetical protein ACFCUT_06715 [Kiloniellaceae bacterium]